MGRRHNPLPRPIPASAVGARIGDTPSTHPTPLRAFGASILAPTALAPSALPPRAYASAPGASIRPS